MFDEFIRTSSMTLVSLIYLFLVFILYNLKGKNEKITNRIFALIMYFTFFLGVLFLIWAGLAVSNNELKFIVGRIATFGFTCWDILLLFYIVFVFRDNEKNIEFFKKHKLKMIIIGVLIMIVCLVLAFVLPIEIYRTRIRFTHHIGGAVATFEQCVRNLVILFSFVSILKNNKKIDALTKVLFGVLMCICAIQLIHVLVGPFKLNDDILINVFAIFFMYLSIESQDKILLNEYNLRVKNSRELSDLKSNFMKNISHQIRTPMSVIVGMGEYIMLNEELSEEEIRKSSGYVKEASVSLLNLVNSIFDLSRIDSDKEIINIDDYHLDSVIFDISSNINSKLKENLIFTINADEICPNDLVGDGHKLCKILNIFITNAVNHTAYGEVSLNVSCTQIDSLNYEFTFWIKNTGHDMSNDMFNISFEDIVQMSDIDYNVVNLVVAKNLLDMIGGTVEFINETGKGTQYIIKIKQKLSGQSKLGNIREKIQTSYDMSHRILNLLGKRVLVIEQEKSNFDLLNKYLSQYNLIVDTSMEINDANNLINSNNYEMIFVNDKFNELNLNGQNVKVIGLVDKTSVLDGKNYFDKLYYPLEFRDVNKIINNIYQNGEVK